MRHGRLAPALALAAFASLAAAQSPPSEFGVDRQPDAPAPSAQLLPGLLGLSPVAADAPDDKAKDKAPPSTDKPPLTADKAPAKDDAPKAIPPSAATTLPPTAVSCLPPGGAVLPPNGGTVLVGPGPVDSSRFWVSAEYLWWRLKKDTVPPLVTTGPATFPVGFLGVPGTRVLLGGELDNDTLNGVRVRAGMWLDDCHTIGLEASGFCLQDRDRSTVFSSNQFPVLARPFTDVNPGGPNSEFLAFPGFATGTVTVANNLNKFCGATLAARCPLCCSCCGGVDALAGLQYLNLEEELSIVENTVGSPAIPVPGAAGTRFIAIDSFKTRNRFYGGFVGLDAHTYHGCWTFGATGTFGVGCNQQQVDVTGAQIAIPAGGTPTVRPGGLLALPGANIGRFTNNEVSTVTELGLNVGYQLTSNIQLIGGYTWLYWTHVVRPGTEIDPVLDVNRIPLFTGAPATAVRPIVPFNQTNFWAQGVSVGVRFSW
jgi:Putative beta barrel porin-7 (BBP7)